MYNKTQKGTCSSTNALTGLDFLRPPGVREQGCTSGISLMGQSPCSSVTYLEEHPKPCIAAMSVDCTPWHMRSVSSVVAAVVLRG